MFPHNTAQDHEQYVSTYINGYATRVYIALGLLNR